MRTDDEQAYESALHEMELDTAYPWVKAWGRLIGLTYAQARAMQEQAEKDEAPAIAVIRTPGEASHWVLLTDVEPSAYETRLYLLDWASSRNLTIPEEVLRVWLDPNAVFPASTDSS